MLRSKPSVVMQSASTQPMQSVAPMMAATPAMVMQVKQPAMAMQAQQPAMAMQAQQPAMAMQAQQPAMAMQAKQPAMAMQAQQPAMVMQAKQPAMAMQAQPPVSLVTTLAAGKETNYLKLIKAKEAAHAAEIKTLKEQHAAEVSALTERLQQLEGQLQEGTESRERSGSAFSFIESSPEAPAAEEVTPVEGELPPASAAPTSEDEAINTFRQFVVSVLSFVFYSSIHS
jgi:hypothetical protein